MKLNKIEFFLMNNPIRAALQKKEAQKMRALSQLKQNAVVLEIGCGRGVGTNLIKHYFKPRKITAIDLDPKMIAIAKRRNKDKDVTFQAADASKLPFKNKQFDAVFDFGIIHHIPNWKDCLKELKRVLKPNGELILEDLSKETFQKTILGGMFKPFLDHPYKQMYTQEEFFKELDNLEFVVKRKVSWYKGHFIVVAT